MEVTDTVLVNACSESYKDIPYLLGFNYHKIKDNNNECVIFYNDKQIIIAFTGSDDVKDWISNFKVIKVKTVFGRIHKGFLKTWETLNPHILGFLHEIDFYGKDIYITGHSLGGAIASICAVDFLYKENVKKLVTFASPRVGDYTWKRTFNKSVTFYNLRYVNNQDIATRFPTWNYFHISTSVYFDNEGDIVKSRPFSWKFLFKTIESITDHLKKNYVWKVEKNNL